MIKIQPQLDTKKVFMPLQARYVQNRLIPLQGNSFTASQNQSQTTAQFPDCVWNPSKTILEFTVNCPATPAATVPQFPADFCSFFNKLNLRTSEGETIINIENVDRYTKCSLSYMNDPYENSQTEGYICPSYRQSINATDNGNDCDNYIDNTGTGTIIEVPPSSITSKLNYFGPLVKTTSSLSSATAYSKTYSISLAKLFPETFFSLDKDISTHPMTLELSWKSYIYWGFVMSTNASPPVISQLPSNITISNITILYYVQADADVCKIITDSMQTYIIPYIYGYVQNFNNGSGTLQTSFKPQPPSKDPDNRLLKVYYLVNQPDGAGGAASCLCNSSNVTATALGAGTDPLASPKLFSGFQQTIKGKLTLNLLSYKDITSHVLINHEHCFEGDLDFMVNSCIPSCFSTELCGKHLIDGETVVGLPLDDGYFDIGTSVQTSLLFDAAPFPVNHHAFAIILTRIYVFNNVLTFDKLKIK